MVKLDPVTHIYTVTIDGIERHPPCVSNVTATYFPPSKFYTVAGRDKGSARHLWYAAIMRGDDIENEPDERIAAEIGGFRKFVREVQPEFIFGEQPMWDPDLDVCGTADIYCKVGGRFAVIDAKPKSKLRQYEIQTAAYKRMLNRNGHPVLDRYALMVRPSGYTLDPHLDDNDVQRWESMVAGYRAAQFYK